MTIAIEKFRDEEDGSRCLQGKLSSFLREVEAGLSSYQSVAVRVRPPWALPTAFPKDRADRIIGATALVEGVSLITADRDIRRSKLVPTFW